MSIPINGLAPMLQVFDMPASLAFYRDALGFECVSQAGPPDDIGWVLLRRGDVELMLNTAYEKADRPPAPDAGRVAAHVDTVLYFGCPDLEAAYQHLQAKGIPVGEPAIAPYGMRQLYVKDPDGFTVCFQWPVERSHDPA
jgi:catechol 2,3-dioxygenase-like lactoylglutathione lyase family enzyme